MRNCISCKYSIEKFSYGHRYLYCEYLDRNITNRLSSRAEYCEGYEKEDLEYDKTNRERAGYITYNSYI